MSSITNTSASSALSMLNSMASTSGVFGALTGGSSTASPSISALGVSNPYASAGDTIKQITQNQAIQKQKNNIYKTIADRINAVATGQITPKADWEKLGGYYAANGQPFVITLDSKGQPSITPQNQMDGSRFSNTRRTTIAQALDKLATLAPEVKANTDYDNLKNQWTSISVDLVDIKNNQLVPTKDWQQQAATIMSLNHPISFSLTSDGKVSVEDQTTSTFQDKDPAIRNTLIKASRMVADAVSADMSYNSYVAKGQVPPSAVQDKQAQYSQYAWVQDAAAYASMGIPYTLNADPTQIDTSVNYVTKTEKTDFSNGQPSSTSSYTVNQNGVDGFGFPDTTSDASNPQPFAAANRITTSIAGITDASGNPISPIKYANPVNVVSTAADTLAVTDTVTGNTDKFAFDKAAGTLTVTTTNKAGTQIGSTNYTATGLSAVASEPPTTRLVDGTGKTILAGGSGLPVTYTNAVTVKNVDANTMTVTDDASGKVDTYATVLDSSGNPVKDAKGNYQISLSHADSLGRSLGAPQTFAAASPGVNAIASATSAITIAADGANTSTAISKTTVLPVDKFASATGGNGNKLTSSITDGSGNAIATYTDPVSIAKDSAGTITVTNKASGNVDTYSDGGNGTISISHKDSAGDVIAAATTASGSGLNAVVSQTPTLSFTDGSGAAIKDDKGNPLPTYANPVTIADTSSGTGSDKSFKVTDAVTGYVDTYSYAGATNSLTMSRVDKNGTQLSTQTASAITGFNATTTPLAVGVTDSAGAAVLDANGAAPPSYTTPVSFKDTGNGTFSVTNSSTGAVDQYAYDSAAQSLTITRNDSTGNTLSTQSFSGVAKLAQPWMSMSAAGGGAATWDVFNKTTLRSTLASASTYKTSYDTSNFDLSNPTSHTDTANAYSSTTSFTYSNVNVGNPTLMQSALPNLKLNYVTNPKITVSAVTDIPMPTSVEAAKQPYDLSTTSMPKWQADAVGFMKAGTPFMLDFDQQGNLTAKKLTGDAVVKFNNPQAGVGGYNPNASQSTGYSGVALMLSTVA